MWHKSMHPSVCSLWCALDFWFDIVSRVDNPGKSIGGHRSSTAVPSVATSVAVTVFAVATGGPPVGNGGHRWAIGGDRRATDGPSVGYGGPSNGRRWKVPKGWLPSGFGKKRFCKNYVFNVLNIKIACQKHVENSKSQFEFINSGLIVVINLLNSFRDEPARHGPFRVSTHGPWQSTPGIRVHQQRLLPNCGSTGFFGGQRGQQALWADAKEQSHVPPPGDCVSTASSYERKRKGKRWVISFIYWRKIWSSWRKIWKQDKPSSTGK